MKNRNNRRGIHLLIMLLSMANTGVLEGQTSNHRLIYRQEGHKNAYPRLSKDQKRIMYQSDSSGKWALYIMDIKKQTHIKLIGDSAYNYFFADWSPDNQWISFSSDRDGNEEIYLMRSDGTGLKRISTDSSRDIHPYFSPDGAYILFSSTRGNGSLDIYRYTIRTGKTERFTNTPQDETCARYSPDMSHIVYLKNSLSEDDLYVMDLANFLGENISKTPNRTDGWPMYSPDGEWIYYSAMSKGTYGIYRMHTDGSNLEALTFPEPGEEHARVCVSAGGRYMVYNRQVGDTIEIWACELI